MVENDHTNESSAEFQHPIYQNLARVGMIIKEHGNDRGHAPGLCTLDVGNSPTEGYSAICSNTSGEFVTVIENIPAAPENKAAKRDSKVAVTLHKDGVLELSVDPTKVQEAMQFEDPANADGKRIYKRKWGNKIRIKAPIKNLGPNTQKFVTGYSTQLLERFQKLA